VEDYRRPTEDTCYANASTYHVCEDKIPQIRKDPNAEFLCRERKLEDTFHVDIKRR